MAKPAYRKEIGHLEKRLKVTFLDMLTLFALIAAAVQWYIGKPPEISILLAIVFQLVRIGRN